MLRGITTCEVKSGYGLELTTELKMLRAIQKVNHLGLKYPELIPTCLAAHMTPPEFDDPQSYHTEALIWLSGNDNLKNIYQ